MKLCVIGPKGTVDRMCEVIKKFFPELQITPIVYQVYHEVLDYFPQIQDEVDMILFPGAASFKLCEKHFMPKVPWEYIPRHGSILLRSLLEAECVLKKDITNLSIDTYTEKVLQEAYDEIGIDPQKRHLYIAQRRLTEDGYLDYLLDFHKRNYEENHVSCCITGLTEVYVQLKKWGIPCVKTVATANIIIELVKKLKLRYNVQVSGENEIVAMVVELNLSSKYSVTGNDQYVFLNNRLKVLQNIYRFSYRVDGVVVEKSDREFLIFTTRKYMDAESNGLQQLYFLDLLRECGVTNISIGVGYGNSAAEAQKNAARGAELSREEGDCAFVFFANGKSLGPIFLREKRPKEQLDQDFSKLAKESHLSINTIYKVYSSTVKLGKKEYTSKELADLCGFTHRTMNRILVKLIEAGCCEIVGESIIENYGRPSRILKFHWFKKE